MQQLQIDFNSNFYDIPNANTELVYEDTIDAASGAEVQGFVVQDPELHAFLSDIYGYATPSKEIVQLRQESDRDFARYHKGDYAYTSLDQKMNRFRIEVITF